MSVKEVQTSLGTGGDGCDNASETQQQAAAVVVEAKGETQEAGRLDADLSDGAQAGRGHLQESLAVEDQEVGANTATKETSFNTDKEIPFTQPDTVILLSPAPSLPDAQPWSRGRDNQPLSDPWPVHSWF